MIVKLLTEHHLEFLSLKGGCIGSSESTLFKMSNCWNLMSRLKYHSISMKNIVENCTESGTVPYRKISYSLTLTGSEHLSLK